MLLRCAVEVFCALSFETSANNIARHTRVITATMPIVMKMQANILLPEPPALCLSAFIAEVASGSFPCLVLLTWEYIFSNVIMEYSESTCLLPCEGGGTAGISAISFTGESKLGISSSFSVMEFLLRFFVLSMTAYTAVVESAITAEL
jgi:hypothetical protein